MNTYDPLARPGDPLLASGLREMTDRESGLDLSHAIYRLVDTVDRALFHRGR